MGDERWRQVEALFHEVAALPAEEQARFLDDKAPSTEVRAQVEELLSWDGEAGDFIESAIGSASARAVEDHDPLERRQTLGKYEVYGPIGRGGFGVVYRGHDPDLGREVAIKSCSALDPALRRRFLQEAQIAARLQHSAIVVVHDLLVEEGMPFMVQELLGGDDLSELIRQEEPLSIADRVSILAQVARGLAYAHEQGVVHRDVKPSNIRVLPGPVVKLLDFGVAKLLHEPTDLTMRGSALGTLGYLAPEQLEGGEVDPRSDLFSFGVVAFELLGGRRPFEGDTVSEVSYRMLHQEPLELRQLWPECPPELSHLVARCLRKERSQRSSGFAPVLEELEALRRRHQDDPVWRGVLSLAAPGEERTAVLERASRGRLGGWKTFQTLAACIALLVLVTLMNLHRRGFWDTEPVRELAESVPSEALAEEALVPLEAASVPAKATTAAAVSGSALLEVEAPVGESDRAREKENRSFVAPPPLPPPLEEPPEEERVADAPISSPTVRAGVEQTSSMGRSDAPVGLPAVESQPVAGVESNDTAPASMEPIPVSAPPEVLVETADIAETVALLVAGEGVQAPRLIDHPPPVYPRSARRRKQEGRVVVAVLVDETGSVLQALVQRSQPSGLGFEEAALVAAKAARFEPARRAGVSGKMWTELPFEFTLAGKRR